MTTPSWLPGYYDDEAGDYDQTRGGRARARAAAEAIDALLPARGRCLDVAGGTGAVSAELADLGWSVVLADLSAGMLRLAADRLPHRVLRASADRLPVRTASVDLVTVIWMFNLVPTALVDAVIAEAARVLVTGGSLVCTVDKELSHADTSSIDSDADGRVTTVAGTCGLVRSGSATFSGRTKWPTPHGRDAVFRLAAFRSV